MTKISLLPLVVLVLVLLLAPLATAEIKSFQMTADSRYLVLFQEFAFTRFGHVTISVSSVSFTTPADPSRLGFFLLKTHQKFEEGICILESHSIHPLFTFKDLISPKDPFNLSFPVTTPNEYGLYFANCDPENPVSMHVTTEIYNLHAAAKDYLPVGQTPLPLLYSAFALAYFVLLAVWGLVLVSNRPFFRPIHLLMGILILVKAFNLICAAEAKHHVKVSGTPHGWELLFYVFQFVRVTLLFTVIVLIGTSWSMAKKVLMIVIPLQVVANIAFVMVEETGPFFNSWIFWYALFVMIDTLCCSLIIWHSCSFVAAETTSKVASKITLFKQFYSMVFGYLSFNKFFLFWLRNFVFGRMISAYKYQWAIDAVEEIATLAFYLAMFHMLRPFENNLYFVIDGEEKEEAAAQQIPKDVELGL